MAKWAAGITGVLLATTVCNVELYPVSNAVKAEGAVPVLPALALGSHWHCTPT